jgi:hypothetical protein
VWQKKMRKVEIPALQFSNWYHWNRRSEFPDNKFPGVYLISVTSRSDLHGLSIGWKLVSYIGMTIAKGGLSSRWRQFDRAIRGGIGHSGGRAVYQEMGPYPESGYNVYVAARVIECNQQFPSEKDYLKMGWVAFYEFEAFSMYHKKVGGHPRYNKR